MRQNQAKDNLSLDFSAKKGFFIVIQIHYRRKLVQERGVG